MLLPLSPLYPHFLLTSTTNSVAAIVFPVIPPPPSPKLISFSFPSPPISTSPRSSVKPVFSRQKVGKANSAPSLSGRGRDREEVLAVILHLLAKMQEGEGRGPLEERGY